MALSKFLDPKNDVAFRKIFWFREEQRHTYSFYQLYIGS